MSPVEWFYAQENQRFGPVSAAELKALADAGKLRPEDLVWREGMDDWAPARRVKGLFEPEAPASPPAGGAASSSPAATEDVGFPPVAPSASMALSSPPSSAGRSFEHSPAAFYRARESMPFHILDFLLGLVRRTSPAALVDATCQTFALLGYYGLYGAMGLLFAATLIQTLETKQATPLGWGLAGLLTLIVFQYTAGRFLPALDRLNKNSSERICSAAFLDCLALVLLAVGAASVLGLVVYAVQQNQYLLVVLAAELFIVMELAALAAIAPETVRITVSADTRVGEEALGVWAFLLKLALKLTPVLFGLGVLHGTIVLLYCLVLMAVQKNPPYPMVWSSFWYLAGAAVLPLIVYLAFLSGYLIIDLMRAVLELPRLLQKLRTPSDQQPSEEG